MSTNVGRHRANGAGGVRFWEALSEAERGQLRTAGTLRRYPAGTILFHEGDPSGSVLIILRGVVKVLTMGVGGNERLLAVRGYGEVLGEISAMWQVPRSATVQVIEPVVLLSIPPAAFERALRRFPSAAMELIRVLGERRRDADQERTEFGGSSVYRRVALALVEVATQYRAADGTISLPFTQDELASLAATSRSGVARALAVLRGKKLVVTAPRQIVLLDIGALHAEAAAAVSGDTAAAEDIR